MLIKKSLTKLVDREQAIHNSQWSVRCAHRARLPSAAYWAYFALLRHWARASCAPATATPSISVSAKILRISERGNCKGDFALENGIFRRKIAPSPLYTLPGTIEARESFGSTIRHGRSAPSHRAAFSGPVFRGCALRFAPCAHHFSPSGLRMLASSLAALPCAHNSQ